MSDASRVNIPFAARVIEVEAPDEPAPVAAAPPQVIVTERTEPVVPTQRAIMAGPRERGRPSRDRVATFGIAGVAVFLTGWVAVDAAAWISAAFEHGAALGIFAAAVVTAGVAGAGAVAARELTSLLRLKSVEAVRRRFSDAGLAPAQTRATVADVLAVLPRDRETESAIKAFQRQIQTHHGTLQQIELLSRTVMQPLGGAGMSHRRPALASRDQSHDLDQHSSWPAACGIARRRETYGHRPTTAATIHLLRRLLLEAGKLGAVDIASASVQHLGGAVTERIDQHRGRALRLVPWPRIIVMICAAPIAFAQDGIRVWAPSCGRRAPPSRKRSSA
jgi:uncharacterized membrane protein YcjF (UPF0283 family)